MAVLSRLLPVAAAAFGLQTFLASIFVPLENEKYYDAAGSLGFITSTAVSLYYPYLIKKYTQNKPIPSFLSFSNRQIILSTAVTLWATRLGAFLLMRNLKSGGNSFFEETKKQPLKFFAYWIGQANWVMLVGLPVYLVNVLPPGAHPPLNWVDYTGLAIFAGSLITEALADYQKSSWRSAKGRGEHEEKFISSGLWSLSRHPNFVGEVGVWTGIWLMSLNSIRTSSYPRYIPVLAAVSPLMMYFLLSKVSGVPVLEENTEKKLGDDSNWKMYKHKVPVFFPWMPAN